MHFVPLHIHTAYTFLSSCLKIDDIISLCKKNSFSYIGISDIENAYAFPSFSKACIENNIKPIFGTSLYLQINNKKFLFCVYVKSEEGYRNLCYLISNSSSITEEILNKHKKGLILVIPCKTNVLVYNSFKGNYIDEIHRILYSLQRGFDDSYLGIELYQKEDKEVMKKVREYAMNYSNKLLAFPLHLYETKKDHIVLELLNAIKNNSTFTNETKKEGPYYFLSELALSSLYTKEEIASSIEIANSIDFTLEAKRGQLLRFNPDSLLDTKKSILFKCKENMTKNHIPQTKEYLDRLNYELDIIEKMGYLDYFLIVSDYVNEAKKRKIPVGPGRGSAVGSLVSYALGITEIDTFKYNLIFERFLNPERVSMPDIDIDVSDVHRDELINYIINKYGISRTSSIVTFQTIGAKQALRDVGRVISFNPMDVNTIAMACRGNGLSLEDTRKKYPEFNSLCKDSYYSKLYSLALRIEGFIRQPSIHPAGIILNDSPLESLIPTTKDENGYMISQYEHASLEEQGFLKMDILSLRTLTLIERIVNKINYQTLKIDLHSIPLNDSKTFLTLNAGLTLGIFQIEKTDDFKNAIKDIKIECFDDIVALLALCRPGPKESIKTYAYNKNENTKIDYIDSSLEDILSPTYGIIIYQEQIMQIAQKVASFSLGEADLFRRAISSKNEAKMAQLKDRFVEGALKNHYSIDIINKIYNLIYKFASYGFNKSHSVAYSMITYQMAYLKAHYPCEFYSSLLDTQSLADNKYIKYMNELNLFDISIELPDINYSTLEYRVKFKSIVIPFVSIKGLPFDICKAIVYERNTNGPFKDIISFVKRMYDYQITIKDIASLIKSGCFDSFDDNRTTLLYNLNRIFDYAETTSKKISVFSEEELETIYPSIIKREENEIEKCNNELETLGILLSGSLFSNYSESIKKYDIKSIKESMNYSANTSIAVFISGIRIITTKKKQTMATLKCYDNDSLISATMFSDIYEKYKINLVKNKPLVMNGYFRNEGQYGINFVVHSINLLEENKK